ncbi:MAG: HD-GYP domain-containing protein, partial [Acidobacteriota bacterium]
VGQVYERENGSGFPAGLKGGEILEEAKILGIADVFEACIHDRPYRKAVTGYQLLEELTRGGTRTFSDHIVKALVRSFSLYPYNEYVILNTNEVGQVVEVNPENLLRPVVKILYDSQGKPLREPREIDLAQNPSHSITKAITYKRLPPVPKL